MILTPDELKARLQPRQRLMGLDLGTRTIGVAVTDVERRTTRALTIIARRKFTLDAQDLLKLAAREDPGAFILGLPLNMDGSEGPRAQSTRSFARHFGALTDIPIVFEDERLTSAAADWALAGSGRKAGGANDAVAAALILDALLKRIAP
jgi:putative Holliday junction resolvase